MESNLFSGQNLAEEKQEFLFLLYGIDGAS